MKPFAIPPHEPGTPRIPALNPPYTPPIADLLTNWMPPGSGVEPLALFRTLAVHDELETKRVVRESTAAL